MNRTFLIILTFWFSSTKLLLAADLDEARDHFITDCLGCHAFACNKRGPMLSGLLGRKAGSAEGFEGYTNELANYNVIWTEETLSAFLKDPSTVVQSGDMVQFGKIEDESLRLQMIEFLKTEDPSINLC